MQLRLAEPDDLPAIADIYNHEIVHGTGTFDTDPVTVDERAAWLRAHDRARRPVVVATDGGEVLGWASLSRWSDRCAYARAVEVSIYVGVGHRRRGVGRALLVDLIERARAGGVGVLLARICSEGEGSLALHRSLGFGTIGTMRRVGEKFGRVLDVELLDLHLDARDE